MNCRAGAVALDREHWILQRICNEWLFLCSFSAERDCLDTQRLFSPCSCYLCFSLQCCWEVIQIVILCPRGFVCDIFMFLFPFFFFVWPKIKERENRTSHCCINSSLHSNNEKCFPSSVLQCQSYSLTWGSGEQQEKKIFSNLLDHCSFESRLLGWVVWAKIRPKSFPEMWGVRQGLGRAGRKYWIYLCRTCMQ